VARVATKISLRTERRTGVRKQSAGGTPEISQLRSGWLNRIMICVLKGRWKRTVRDVPPSFQDGMILRTRHQPSCGWLISGCPFGTKRSAVRRGIVVASRIKQRFKLRQERNMPPRRGWRIWWRGWLQRFRYRRSCEPVAPK
jgi:hypothetical protein